MSQPSIGVMTVTGAVEAFFSSIVIGGRGWPGLSAVAGVLTVRARGTSSLARRDLARSVTSGSSELAACSKADLAWWLMAVRRAEAASRVWGSGLARSLMAAPIVWSSVWTGGLLDLASAMVV